MPLDRIQLTKRSLFIFARTARVVLCVFVGLGGWRRAEAEAC